jgi:hypothetical protein
VGGEYSVPAIESAMIARTYGNNSDIDRGVKIAIIRPFGKSGKDGRAG